MTSTIIVYHSFYLMSSISFSSSSEHITVASNKLRQVFCRKAWKLRSSGCRMRYLSAVYSPTHIVFFFPAFSYTIPLLAVAAYEQWQVFKKTWRWHKPRARWRATTAKYLRILRECAASEEAKCESSATTHHPCFA